MKRSILIFLSSFLLLSTRVFADNDTSISLPTYREFFTDSALQRMILQALDSNIDLRIALERVNEAEASLIGARSALFPKLMFDGNGEFQHLGNDNATSYKIGVTPSWEIDIFGQQRNQKLSAQANVEASKAYAQTIQTEMIATLARGYYTLLMLDEQKRLSEEALQNWQQTEKTLKALRDVGKTNKTAVQQAHANILRLQSNMLTIDKNITIAKNSLCIIIGYDVSDYTRSNIVSQHFSLFTIHCSFLDNRPDVRQARLQLIASDYDTKAARARFYPQLTLSGFLGWTNNGTTVNNPEQIFMNMLGSLAMPILNHGQIKADVKAAQSRQKQAALNFQKTVLLAGQEINDALISFQTAQQQVELIDSQISTLDSVVETTIFLMQNTSITYLEVLSAQQSLLEAKLSAIENRYNYFESLITLYKAIGGGI